jgi:hypothetical protein
MTETKPKRRWTQFSLRTFLVFIAVIAIGCGWFAVKLSQARQQRQAVEAIRSMGGQVIYDFAYYPPRRRRAPDWVIEIFGIDFCQDVVAVLASDDRTMFVDADVVRWRESFRRLPKLFDLDLSGTGITDVGLKCVEELPQLEKLYLADTKITDAGLASIEHLSHLNTLYLGHTSIGDAGLRHLGKLVHLRLLTLENTNVRGAGLEQLNRLPLLVCIELRETRITDSDLKHLKGMIALRELNLEGTDVTDAGVDYLKEELPNLSEVLKY